MHEVPFEPGASPFRCKGLLYLDSFAYFDERFQGGRGMLLRHVDDPRLARFFAQHFVIGGWYDVFPLLALQGLASRITGTAFLEIVREVAKFQIPRHLQGIYKFLLKMSSPELVMSNLPRLGEKYYDFLHIEGRLIREKTYETITAGVPEIAASAYFTSSDVAIRSALELTGAKGVRIHRHPLERTGEAHGLPLVRMKRAVSWS